MKTLLAVIILQIIAVSNADDKCSKFWEAIQILTKANEDQVGANNTGVGPFNNGTVVKLTCVDSSKQVNGSDISVCVNGKWTNKPNCIERKSAEQKDPIPWAIIGGFTGGGVIIVVPLIVILVIMLRKKNNASKHQRTEVDSSVQNRNLDLSANHIKSRQTDSALYHEVYDGQKRTGYSNDDMRSASDSRYVSGGSMDLYRHSDGISLIGSSASILGVNNIPIFKVWTCRRTRRKFIKAENLENLKRKASAIFQYENPVRFALEEDGTDIENDDILALVAGNTLTVLSGNEQWTDKHSKSDNIPAQKYTFDVCSDNRTVRKLIMAENLKDLLYQAPTYFGYHVTVICLEIDGTCVENDDTLMAVSSQLLMALGNDHIWTTKLQDLPSIEDIHRPDLDNLSKSAVKVWSEDFSIKKILKADNCIDLHIKVAAEFGLEMPIQIRVKDEDTIISTDKVLENNAGKVLIATQRNPPTWVGKDDNSSLHDKTDTKYYNVDQINTYSSIQQTDRERNTPNSDGRKRRGQGNAHVPRNMEEHDLQRPNDGNRKYAENDPRRTNNVIHPDIIASTLDPDLMPSRYGPSSYLGHNKPYTEPGSKNTTNRSGREAGPSYNARLNENNPLSESLKPSTERESDNSLPYEDLTPLHHLNLRELSHPQQNTTSAVEDGLPYADLRPSHISEQNKNNFDMMRLGEHAFKKNSLGRDREFPVHRQPSFLVTGGAKQSGNSDVLF